jgi:hypothetical protein
MTQKSHYTLPLQHKYVKQKAEARNQLTANNFIMNIHQTISMLKQPSHILFHCHETHQSNENETTLLFHS